jgi:predicted RecA/RadA family phage recombinase
MTAPLVTFDSGQPTPTDHTPTSDVKGGDVLVVGAVPLIALHDIPANNIGSLLAYGGNFIMPKAVGSGTALAAFSVVYWDAVAKQVTLSDGGGVNGLMGYTHESASDDINIVRVNHFNAAAPIGVALVSSGLESIIGSPNAFTLGLGSTCEYTLGLSSIGLGTITQWSIDWGDGGGPEVVAGDPSTATHAYQAGGPVAIVATATDEYGDHVAPTLNITVSVEEDHTISGDPTATVNVPYTVQFDPKGHVTAFFTINWGDGDFEVVRIPDAREATHTYTVEPDNVDILVTSQSVCSDLTMTVSGLDVVA